VGAVWTVVYVMFSRWNIVLPCLWLNHNPEDWCIVILQNIGSHIPQHGVGKWSRCTQIFQKCSSHLKILGTMVQSVVAQATWPRDLCTHDVEDHTMSPQWAWSFTALNEIKFFWKCTKSVNLKMHFYHYHFFINCYGPCLAVECVDPFLSRKNVIHHDSYFESY
jgi:hypothetical protein